MSALLKLVLVVFFTTISFVGFSQTKVTVIGDSNYFPYSYKEGGEMKGIYTEIMKTAFSRMSGYNISVDGMPWKRGLAKTKKGEIFAIYPPYLRPKARPFINPYSESILGENVILLCHKDIFNKSRSKWPEDFYGLNIGQNNGFDFIDDAHRNAVKSGKIKASYAKSATANIRKLDKKKIDCYINDRFVVLQEAKKQGKMSSFKEGPTLKTEQGYLGFAKNGKFPFKNDFIAKFNTVIKQMKASGEIQKILDKYKK